MKTSRPRRRHKKAAQLTSFWDTSAIVPLCTIQAQSAPARQAARIHSRQVVWWATPVEATSAFQRLVREGEATSADVRKALTRLEYLRERWNEVQPTEDLRRRAERLLATHSLRAADALQLAAALIWCSGQPRSRVFIAADTGLAIAAEDEGFSVIRV